MARLNTIAIGPGRGSAGDATYRKSRGRTIMSARIKENPSNTALQQKQRKLFGETNTALANQPWFVANFAKSKYGSEINHLQHINRKYFASPTWGFVLNNPDLETYFMQELVTSTYSMGHDFYFAHGDAEYYNTIERVHSGSGIRFAVLTISQREALTSNASISIRGRIKVSGKQEGAINAVFRLQQVNSSIWNSPEPEVTDILAEDKLPFYIDGAGLAHVLVPIYGWASTTFKGWSAQWKQMEAVGYAAINTFTLPDANLYTYGTPDAYKYDYVLLMLNINGKPVTYFKPGEVVNSQEAPVAAAAAPAKAPKKKAKKADKEEAEK